MLVKSNYIASLPKKRMGAGALFRNTQRQILMVVPSYKPVWEIPGGVVEYDESPYEACKREVEEELGLQLPLYQMLCVDYNTPTPEKSESLMFIFYGGDLTDATIQRIAVDGKEIVDYEFMALEDIEGKTTDTLYRRIAKSIQALENNASYYLENQSFKV